MSSKPRLPNKTQWGLKDISDAMTAATRYWKIAMKRAEKQMDPTMIYALARLRDCLAYVERKTVDASQGEYRQEDPPDVPGV